MNKTIDIKVYDKVKNKINRGMFGLFFEDINYALDGGLHAEMIENRSFEFYKAGGYKYNWYREYDGLYGWEGENLKIKTEQPLNEINPHYLCFTAGDNRVLKNKAYDGICMKPGLKHRVSMYMKTADYVGRVYVEIVKDGSAVAEAVIAESVSSEWKKYEAELVCEEGVSYADFTVRLENGGSVCFDFVSMIPGDAVYGIFRKDLADILRDMRPGFLRFPGGCVVEGNTIENMYRWKETVCAPEERRANWNRWAVHGNSSEKQSGSFSHYNQTLGIGYYEYFLLCEYIGASPLPVCNVGLACQYESKELFELESPEFPGFLQDAVDLIEFANGPADSVWGKRRAQLGHPEPFNLVLLGIGNEQWDTPESRFFERYVEFEKAIHDKYPDIKLIGSAGPDVTSEHYTDAWEFYNKKAEENANFAYAVDEHYYVRPEWLASNSGFYDNYPREVKVFAGEYAGHIEKPSVLPERNTMGAALGEAAFMTGLERNSDVVVMASYAPLFARERYVQWAPDLIWFDAERAYGTPSYYVQKLYATMTGDAELVSERAGDGILHSVSLDKSNGTIYLKLVNTSAEKVLAKLNFEQEIAVEGKAVILSGEAGAYNCSEAPDRVVPYEKSVNAGQTFDYEIGSGQFHVLSLKIK